MTVRRFKATGLEIRLIDLGPGRGTRVDIEHATGAALLVPRADVVPMERGLRFSITCFDGVELCLDLDGSGEELVVASTAPTPLLGGATRVSAKRIAADERRPGALRVTGDEATMPIPVDEP